SHGERNSTRRDGNVEAQSAQCDADCGMLRAEDLLRAGPNKAGVIECLGKRGQDQPAEGREYSARTPLPGQGKYRAVRGRGSSAYARLFFNSEHAEARQTGNFSY